MRRVLVVERDEASRRKLILELRAHGIEADGVDGPDAARLALADGSMGAIVVGAERGGVAAPAEALVAVAPGMPLVALVKGVYGDDEGLAAIRRGAVDFVAIEAGGGAMALALALHKVEARRAYAESDAGMRAARSGTAASRPGASAGGAAAGAAPAPVLVGDSPRIAAVMAIVRRVAPVKSTVLVAGESGTGKELVARALHQLAPWRDGPFVAVNCAAIPAGVIESELFGHVRGAFTDAVRDRRGYFDQANGGTLFLDEIADLPLLLQAKLLRALQDGQIRAVGDAQDRRVDVRVVAASARDLAGEVRGGRFREDLYYRLAGLLVQLPSLRARREDIPVLARHFLDRACARLGVEPLGITPEAMHLMIEHPWPGNVRELENTIDRAAVLCDGPAVDVASLPERIVPLASPDMPPANRAGGAASASDLSIKRASRRAEEDLIRRALAQTGGNRTRAAELLEISHRALLYKIKEYGIAIGRAGPGGEDRRA